MTIICAMHEDGVGTWIGSDTIVTAGDSVVGHRRKWIMADGCALAVTGSNAALDLFNDRASEIKPGWSPTVLFGWAKALLDERGFKPDAKEGGTPYFDCSYILATPRRVLSIDSAGGGVDFGHRGFASRGSGCDVADGAAWVLGRELASPRIIIESAIRAACAYVTTCGGEPWVDCLRLAE